MQSWTETRLWKHLTSSASPEGPSIEALLQQWMPDIQKVLNAGTSPLDFTLHDAEHSFRVAEWMAKIVPDDVLPQLSAYELALLLLSAYLHDIGMTPEQARVQRHWRHLVFGPTPEEQRLSPEETAEFQRWLDDEHDGLVPPLAKDGKAGEDDLRRAAELITYYARHKHNDWSGEWIRLHAKGALGSSEGWVEDLVRLCQSHHEGYAELVKEPFDPRPAGQHGEVVHLRYLACVLRVADILDVDPERTPPVLFQHRDIAPKSVIYWWKDHDFKVLLDGPTLVVHARPRSALIEKAVRDTAEWTRLELETCARLDREKPFSHSPFRTSEPLPHRWGFPESLLLQVRPRNDDYVYIDGAFRPNTAKLLELLSGIELYKEPLAAVRELLQNAFDAVKEQIALERLEGDPKDEKRTEAITALQSVELRFEEREGRFWLLCTDSGVGMTRAIIEKYLLVSGSSRRHDILDLERRCETAGFHLGRTGQFGIGVLSYFMLADHVEIRTRRSAERGDAETHGWWFQTEGVGSFGELRKDSQIRRGTTVSLRLRQDVVSNRNEFLSRLQEYLLEVLLRVPCACCFIVEKESRPCLRFDAGWQPIESRLVDGFIRTAETDFRADGNIDGPWLKEWGAVAERFRSALRWKTEVGYLRDGVSQYRLLIPFFELPGGRSGLFFDFDRDQGIARHLPVVDTLALTLGPELRTSFQGMKVRSVLADGELVCAEDRPYLEEITYFGQIDWEGSCSGQLTVDRSTLSLTADASQAVSWLKARSEKLQAMVLSEEPSSYAELSTILNPLVPPPSEVWWFVNAPDQAGLLWKALSFPAVSGSSLAALEKAVQARGDGRLVPIAQPFTVYRHRMNQEFGLGYGESWVCPNRPAVVSTSPLVIIPQFALLPPKSRQGVDFLKGEFPPVWISLAALGNRGEVETWLWNQDHPLVRAVEAQDLEWFESFERAQFSEGLQYPQISEDLLQTRGRSALYLMGILKYLSPENPDLEREWEDAEDFRPGFWRDLWDCVALDPPEIMHWVQETDGEGVLWISGLEDTDWIPATDPCIPQYLPDPGDEWRLTITYRNDAAEMTNRESARTDVRPKTLQTPQS
jgi:hypothetical protein